MNYASYFRRQAKLAKSSKRGQFLQYWQSLANVPLLIQPIPKDHHGTIKAEDGIRVAGSPQFIAAICQRLKDILLFENPNSKIDITYQKSANKKQNGEDSYILYVNIVSRR